MTEKARDSDRDAAIKLVEAAWAVGEIVEADRDKRVEQLQRAQSQDEIRMITHDIQSAAPEVPDVPYGPPTSTPLTPAAPAKASKALILVPLAVVLVVAVAIIGGIVALAGGGVDAIDAGIGGDEPDVLSEAGYDDLLAALEERTGSTTAFSAVLYPTYAVVEVPVDTSTQREEYLYWDGDELTTNDMKSTSSFERTNLATVDPAVIVDLVAQVRELVEDPTTWYAIVRAPDADRAVVWAYASNEYSESEYLAARRNGAITYDSTEQ